MNQYVWISVVKVEPLLSKILLDSARKSVDNSIRKSIWRLYDVVKVPH